MQAALAERVSAYIPLATALLEAERARPALVPTFRGANALAQTITDHEWIISGPADTGKTFGETWRLDSMARETPKGLFAIVRKVRADFNSTIRKRWEATIALRGGVRKVGGDSPSKYVYANGAEVLVIGFDRDSSVLSGEFDGIYVNQAEELGVGDWELLASRVTGRGAVTKTPMCFGDCNPGAPGHWILERSKGSGVKNPPLRLLMSTHKDNPDIYDDAGNLTESGASRLAPLESLTGIRKERYFFGNWKAAEGTVYDFDRSLHVIEKDTLPEMVRHVVSIDFGFTNPFVAQLWGLDNDGRMYLVSEIYRTQTIVEDHAKAIKAMVAGRNVEAYIADHDAEDRATLTRHGISTRAATKAVSPGIQAVRDRMDLAADKKPRLFVVSGALLERDEELAKTKRPISTEGEFESYVWPKGADGKALKEVPVKSDDHGMDAMRYAVAYLDSGRPAQRFETVRGWTAPTTRGF
jgi:phage terminase large subunit